jgi:hypothetical protein
VFHARSSFVTGVLIFTEKTMTFSRRGIGVNPKEALNKDLSLSLDSGRIRLCEAPCGADAALFRDSLKSSRYLNTDLLIKQQKRTPEKVRLIAAGGPKNLFAQRDAHTQLPLA